MTHRSRYSVCLSCGLALSLLVTGCFAEHEETVLEHKPGSAVLRVPAAPSGGKFGGAGAPAAPVANTIGSVATTGRGNTPNKGKLDLLFVIDDAQEAAETQAFLRQRIPPLVRAFADRTSADGPIRDLHVGVVSTDMGVTGVSMSWPACNTAGGRDGWLQTAPQFSSACAAMPWPYLTFVAGGRADQLAHDFECISGFGTGCGLAQPLEAALKAVWPKNYDDGTQVLPPDKNPITFLSLSAEGRYGHGDSPPNLGFARNGGADGPSTLAIIIVTNHEDCSLGSTHGFDTSTDPDEDFSPSVMCFKNKQNLYPVTRYQRGYVALRPGHEDSVLFAAIVGVPEDRVNADARARIEWSDAASRDAFYDDVQSSMEERLVDASKPSGWSMAPSCAGGGSHQAIEGYPAHRMVEVARSFGENGFLQSICQDDFTPLANMIIDRISTREQK